MEHFVASLTFPLSLEVKKNRKSISVVHVEALDAAACKSSSLSKHVLNLI